MSNSLLGISFVIASYNVASSLERCVRSIQAQTLENIQIIIVNDKSTDNTLDIAQGLCDSDPLQRTLCISHLQNRGLAAVRNTGLFAAALSHIWHIDGDDYLPGDNVALQIFNTINNLGLLAVKFPVFDESEDRPFSRQWYAQQPYASNVSQQIDCEVASPIKVAKLFGYGGAFSIVYEKQFAISLDIRNVEGVSIGEDQILVAQLLKKLPCIGILKNVMYVYDKTGPSMMRKVWSLDKYLEDRIYTHFIYRLMSDQPWTLKFMFEARYSYLMSSLRKRASKHLDHNNLALLRKCWQFDYKSMKPSAKLNYFGVTDQSAIDSYMAESINADLSSVFEDIFLDAEIVIHCGAHKTATTFIQSQLHDHRYDLALEGIIYIDTLRFRDVFTAHSKIKTMSDSKIKHNLVECVLPLLFRKPKRIIISEENLLSTDGTAGHFSCIKAGKGDQVLGGMIELLRTLHGCKVTVFYAIREYSSYITSMYCEKIKWASFDSFEAYTGTYFEDLDNVSWKYVIKFLEWAKLKFGDLRLNIINFEEYQSDPIKFVYMLASANFGKSSKLKSADVYFRRSPSQEAVEIALKKRADIGQKSAQSLFKKLVASGFGTKKYNPGMDTQFVARLKQKYHNDCSDLVNITIPDFASSANSSSKIPLDFSTLTQKVSPYVASLTSVKENQPEDLDMSLGSWKTNFSSYTRIVNIEGNREFNIKMDSLPKSKNPGVSAMLRVKNESINIEKVLASCLLVFEEIVVVDNASTDQTVQIVDSFKKGLSKDDSDRIKLFNYPFQIQRCGQENFECPENSVHSLAYFYNYAFSKCSCNHVFKWDGDMFLVDAMAQAFLAFKKDYLESASTMINENCLTHGAPKGITIYKGFDKRFYCQKDSFEQEVRLFPNTSHNRFVKSILWEQLYTPYPVKLVNSDKVVFIEYKDVSQNEFSHWKIGGLGMGMRKRNELRCFKLVAELTRNGSPSRDELENAGLGEVEDLDGSDFIN